MAKLEKKQKIIIGITVPLVIAVIVIVSVLAYFIYFPYQKGEVEKATSINLPSDGVVRVLQLTDLHLVATKTLEEDKQTLKWVEEAIERAKPDIVAVTGDAVGSLSPFRMRDKSLIDLAEIFEEKQVYWMLTFGNHDGEWSYASGREVGADNRDEGKKELADLLKGYKYSLLQEGDTDGVGNYVVDVVDESGKSVYAFVNMDSQDKLFDENGEKQGYSGLTANQIEWYEKQMNALKERAGGEAVKSSLFMHVPLYEYTDAWLNYEHTGGFAPYYTEGKVYCQDVNIGFFDKMQEIGSTDLVAVGHDHDFNFAIDYKDVYFTYGRVSGVNAWGRRTPVGATIIDINVNAQNLRTRYKFTVIEPTFEYNRWEGWAKGW